MFYDLIADIHGYNNQLKELLYKLGYKNKNGYYQHPAKRKVIFLGDFIDRGPNIRETLQIVKAMYDNGTAETVIGNHEYNAICFWKRNLEEGGYYRNHSIKNIHQHATTIGQFKDYESEWLMYLKWFETLPLFIDKGHFRVVHACWDQKQVDFVDDFLKKHSREELFIQSSKKGTDAYHAVEILLKGPEISFPVGYTFTDKDGHVRKEARIKWWNKPEEISRWEDVVMHCPVELSSKDFDTSLYYFPSYEGKPVFVGHYWLTGDPVIQHESVAILDYSVAKGGNLVAYKWNGENELCNERIVFV